MMSLAAAKRFKKRMQPVVDEAAERQKRAAERMEQVALIRPNLGSYDGEPWAEWLISLFLPWFVDKQGRFTGFADFHAEFWRHIFAITPESAPDPYVSIIFREGAKSTMAEMACVRVGGEALRRYGWYICNTQDQADDHVSNVSGLMQSAAVASRYPHLAKVSVDENNRKLGWRTNRLSSSPPKGTEGRQRGFTLDAIGLDKAKRGGRLDEDRPDFIVFDDVDDEQDTVRAIEKKKRRLSQTFLPATAENAVILFVQNMPNPHGIAAQLADNTADILVNRKLSGPHPLVKDLAYEEDRATGKVTITGGTPTWPGFFPLKRVQATVDKVGLNALMVEYQHERHLAGGVFLSGIWHPSIHVIPRIEIPPEWYIDRSFDWGSAKPYGIVWWAESDGEAPVMWHDGVRRRFPKGTLFAVREFYGWTGKPNVGVRHSAEIIADNVLKVQAAVPWGGRVKPGPADASIYTADPGSMSIAERMYRRNVRWMPANKESGSRVAGAERIVSMLRASLQNPMESPGLFVTQDCPNIIRTFPDLPKDPANPDDVDTESEDHLWDLARYRVINRRREAKIEDVGGL